MAQLVELLDQDVLGVAEDQLVARLRRGDIAAFAQIVAEWSPVMLHVARRYVGDRHAAEDVVQDAWLGVINGLGNFEGRSTLRSWTFSILINRAKTRIARDQRTVASAALTGLPDPDDASVDPARFQGAHGVHPGHWTSSGEPQHWTEPEVGALKSEVAEKIEAALDVLPERQRLVVQMRDIQGMSADETCAALAVSQQNQRVLLHRGRAALRSRLEGYYRG
jgi:RNA polymerase sigma-70 factor (ECF subfamily)